MTWLLELADKISRSKDISGFDLDIIIREMYLDKYGISNLDDPSRPLALVAMNQKEDYGNGNYLYERFDQFKIYDINKHYGLSVTEFLDLPRDIVENILTVLRDEQQKIKQMRIQAEAAAKKSDLRPASGVDDTIFIPPHNGGRR